MRFLFIVACMLAMLGCAPSKKPNIVPLENATLYDDYTYIVVANPMRTNRLSQYVFCRDDGSNRYQLGTSRDFVTCEAPDSGLFARADLDVTSVQYRVRDGLIVSFRPVVKRDITSSDPDGAPHFLAGGARQDGIFATAYSGEIGIYRIGKKTIHFVGFEQPNGSIRWRDPGDLASQIAKRVAGATPDRVIVQRPEIVDVVCTKDKKSPVCDVQNRR